MMGPADVWHDLLRPEEELTPAYGVELAGRLRAARLTFGDRIHCPFLRPFFLTEEDAARVARVAETVAALGERVAAAAMESPAMLRDVALTEAEERLVRLVPLTGFASTASRLDAFLLPDALRFAEYNAESPAGAGYTETLAGVFESLPIMARFKERYRVSSYGLMDALLDALLATYREGGGTAGPPMIAIVDWKEVPTWSEFEIIQARFIQRGVPTIVCDPRELQYDGRRLAACGRPVDLVYRRVLTSDIVDRPAECEALVRAYAERTVLVANSLHCKIAHKKALFAVLTDDRHRSLFSSTERAVIRQHVPWTRLLVESRTTRNDRAIDLLPHVRAHREELVLKPNDEYGGSGVTLGWETPQAAWEATLDRALGEADRAWIVQERIAVRRELYPTFQPGQGATLQDMLVDLAPYLFRGRMAGFLTRLSSTGLANVTSGGGQVPAFVVAPVGA